MVDYSDLFNNMKKDMEVIEKFQNEMVDIEDDLLNGKINGRDAGRKIQISIEGILDKNSNEFIEDVSLRRGLLKIKRKIGTMPVEDILNMILNDED